MILAVDIGNTSIKLGIYKENKLILTDKIYTDRQNKAEDFEKSLLRFFRRSAITSSELNDTIISCVVPEVTPLFSYAIKKLTGREAITVGEKHNGKLKVNILPVSQLGADLIAASVGAIEKYPLPCLVADLGTATKILVIDKEGFFRGCTISPGMKISLDALTKNASLLPEINPEKPEKVIGENTVECMQSGVVFGTAAMLDGLIKRIKAELREEKVTVVATGGYSKTVSECCETEIIYDENLLFDGLMAIYSKI